MVHFEGDKSIPRPVADVAGKLSNAAFLVECVPGIEKIARTSEEEAAFVVRPGLGFVRGTLEVTMQRLERVPETSTRWRLLSKGIGTSSTVEARLQFTSGENATQVHWAAEIQQLGGLLKAVPQGLIRAAAQKLIDDVWAAVEARLRAP
jgi:carbon monoxide dehydrogenase subunit G